ncbi:hypothetical protein A6V25_19335 [Nostoc sp. ATCC 53789]|nr:hypothetical protein A6V25_19335 [Nostoc sp. ATCC 53789]
MLYVNVNISLQMKAGGKLPSASYLLAMTVNSELFNAVCHFLSNLTPFPSLQGKGSKNQSLSPCGLPCTHKSSYPPKFADKLRELKKFPPFLRGVRGDRNTVRQLYKTCVYTVALWGRGLERGLKNKLHIGVI